MKPRWSIEFLGWLFAVAVVSFQPSWFQESERRGILYAAVFVGPIWWIFILMRKKK